MEADKETEVWYAMRATYRREPDVMRLLEKERLGCFVPMQYKISIKKGKKVRALVPVVHNLLFVHARPSEVKRIICNTLRIPVAVRRSLSPMVRCSVLLL